METIGHNSQFCFVIASFNNEANIEKNLTSVMTQTNTNWRCIYINDCSTDNTEVLFFDLIKQHNVISKFTYVKNDKNYGQAYSKYTAYKLVNDFEIVCILDGDDWLSDNDVLSRLTAVYSDKSVQMVSTNFNIWEKEEPVKNFRFFTYLENILTNKQFRKQPNWLVRHLKTGYGIFFKSIPKEYLTRNGEWLKVCTDIAEYYSALELSNGKYIAVDDVMYIYNKSNSLKYNTSYFNEKSEDLHKTTLDHILALPPCKYAFPQTYIINMAKCTKKREYMNRQMLFQSNTNFQFIEAIDGSINSETGALMRKYFEYMGVRNSSQYVMFDRSTMIPSYKNNYNFKRQHITRGSLGLIQSAFLLMSEFVKSNEDHALILEDDIYTIQNLDKNLFINKELLRGKDLVYVGCHTSKHDIFPEKSDRIFIDVTNHKDLIYGTYSIIISKHLAQYILALGIDNILRLNLSWDLLLNYIRETEKHRFAFFLYFKQIFIPNVIKNGGINPIKDISFYIKNKIRLHDYYIPEVTNEHTDNDIATIMSTHNENFFFDFVNKVVYINLESRLDRKEHVERQLSRYINNGKIHRFNAIKNEKGAVGCGLSHIAVLEMAIAENWDNVFIAEDDLTWTEHFTTGHNILENLIRTEYDVIVLGGSFVRSYANSFKLISCNCALAYIVNKSYYQTLLTCFKAGVEGLIRTNNQSIYAIDQIWKPLQNRDNWYVIKPNMCTQLPSYSNIENDYKDYDVYFNKSREYRQPTRRVLNSTKDTYNVDWGKSISIRNIHFQLNDLPEESTKDTYNVDWSRSMRIRNIHFQLNDSPGYSPEDLPEYSPEDLPEYSPDDIYNHDNVDWDRSIGIRNRHFQPKDTPYTEPPEPEDVVFTRMGVPTRQFQPKDTPAEPVEPEEVVFRPPNRRNVQFGMEELPSNQHLSKQSNDQIVLHAPKFNKVFIPESKVQPVVDVKNYHIKSVKPTVPAPKIVSFKKLIQIAKTN